MVPSGVRSPRKRLSEYSPGLRGSSGIVTSTSYRPGVDATGRDSTCRRWLQPMPCRKLSTEQPNQIGEVTLTSIGTESVVSSSVNAQYTDGRCGANAAESPRG